jgi:hypothetical protein
MTRQELLNHENLTAFRQHGFTPINASGDDQVFGNCIFCGRPKSFYINPELKKWDCKQCGLNGGYKIFIEEIVKFGKEQFTFKTALSLAKNRGLKAKTLINHNVGLNTNINAYIIPCYTLDNADEILGVKIFPIQKDGSLSKKRAVTSGGKLGSFGWENFKKPFSTCWIVEGEWDYFVWFEVMEIMKKTTKEPFMILGLPSATSFKDEFTQYFKGKNVHVLLDNDPDRKVGNKIVFGAGIEGMIKIYNKIGTIVKTIDFVHWPEGFKDGYDIRDCYNENKGDQKKTFEQIKGYLNQYPPKMEIAGVKTSKTTSSPVKPKAVRSKRTGAGIKHTEVYTTFNKWLKLDSTDLIDVTLGCMLANRLPGDPVWLQLVGPSGCAKSVICMALDCHWDVEAIDTLTPATLISGSTTAMGGDPSLLPKLDGRILVIKDFTTILEMQIAYRNEIFGIFRSVYDGCYAKPFGNGQMTRSGKSKFGFITGVTPAIELYTEGFTALGERFVRYNLGVGNIHQILQQIDRNLEDQFQNDSSMSNELKECFKKVIDFEYDITSIEIPDSVLTRIRHLAIVVELLRGTVPTDRFTKEITHKAISALPTRSYVQFRKELAGIMLFKHLRKPDEESIKEIRDIAVSTIPLSREHILKKIYKLGKGEVHEISKLSKVLKLPTITVQRTIDKLTALDVFERVQQSTLKVGYKLTDTILESIEKGGMYV